MKPWICVTLVGLMLGMAACLSEAPSDPSTEAPYGETEAEIIGTPHPGPDWYYTCSDDLFVCRAGYGAVEYTLGTVCAPRHRIKCQWGAQGI